MGQSLVRGSPRRLLVALGLSICLSASMPGWSSAYAQSATIDAATITSITSLNPTQTAQIEAYVREPLADLASDDPELIRQGRNRLIAPLETAGVGVPFRLNYSNALCPELERLATDERELNSINALRVLGELATDRSSMAVEAGLDHPTAVVRYTAVYAVARTFDAVATESPAVAPQRVGTLMSRLAELLRNDEETWVLDVAVRAMVAAGAIDKDNFRETRAAAYEHMTGAVSDRVRTLPVEVPGPEHVQFMLRATVAARDALTDTRSLPAAAAKNAAGLGGDVLSYIAERLQQGGDEIEAEERSLLNSLGATSQAVCFFAGNALGGNAPAPRPLPPIVGSETSPAANDDAFIRAAVNEISRLYENPFAFPAGRFTRP